MILHHFTSARHLPLIVRDGMLTVTESNIGSPFPVQDGPEGVHAGPPVVWLLDSPEAGPLDSDPADMAHGLYPAKRQIRFEVDVPGIRWLDWAPAAAMSREWRAAFLHAAGGIEVAEHWYVMPVGIRRKRWLSITDMLTGEPITDPGA